MDRITQIQKKLSEMQVDGLLLTSFSNMYYVSSFTGTTATVLVSKKDVYILTDFRYQIQVAKQSTHCNFKLVDDDHPIAYWIEALCIQDDIARLGVEEDHLTIGLYNQYQNVLSDVTLVPVDVSKLRTQKDATEVEFIQKAIDIVDETITEIYDIIAPGMSEKEVEWKLLEKIRSKGGDGFSFSAIVASGHRGSMPHGVASDKVIEESDMVTIDFGAKYKGYCSDLTRTFAMSSKVDPKLVELYHIVLKANEEAIKACGPYIPCVEVDKVARDIITDAGYGAYFAHGTGHGLGIDIHEYPRLNQLSQAVLLPGMVVTVEPGIYIEGLGGIRIEDDILITEDGYIRLTKSPKTLKYIR